jgi:2,4-dienoyl-CoA reductase-like NADH-dependent reductase (Old Yellow Enzyme family)
VRIPVIGVGGIEEGSYIDQSVAEGHLSLAAVGRAILKDPEAWGSRHLRCRESGRCRTIGEICAENTAIPAEIAI